MLNLYQSDVYYIEQTTESIIFIHTNDGREIKIEAKPTDYGYKGILKITEKDSD